MNDESRVKESHAGEKHPQADVQVAPGILAKLRPLGTRIWVLTAICVVVAIVLIVAALGSRGTSIVVSFQQGHGIKPGDTLRHRGIEVGEVESVEIADDLKDVTVRIKMQQQAVDLAREGSQFWIERPRVSLAGVAGLDTVVGAKYIAVQPGPDDAPRKTTFEGVESPLSLLDAEALEITIRFREGNGLAIGDVVKHRGIVVGEVTAVKLNQDLSGVNVSVRLAETASRLARAGSRFWVERPRVAITEIRGLDTLVGGRYIAVSPGPEAGMRITEFEGLDLPPIGDLPADGLEVLVIASSRGGLRRGIPVIYRGIDVGQIVSVSLASDATSVQARAYIQPEFKNLIRENTHFWDASGFDLSIGVTGLKLNADTLSSIAIGSVGIATEDPPGRQVATGHRFTFAERAPKNWVQWQPRIAIAGHTLPSSVSFPEPQRVALNWQAKTIGFSRDQQRQGWVLALDDLSLIGPAVLLAPSDEASSPFTLEIAGGQVQLAEHRTSRDAYLATYRLSTPLPPDVKLWPAKQIRYPSAPEDCLVLSTHDVSVPLTADKITVANGKWSIDPAVSFGAESLGACVLSVKDGALIGILVFDDEKPEIQPMSKGLR
jgi:paraquat-inducible protein B